MSALRQSRRRAPALPGRGPATILDVAARAGVSPSTVSRLLGGQTVTPRPDTAEAVARAVSDLGYRTDLVARSMRTRTTAAVGVVIDDLLDPVFPGMLREIAETLAAAGYATVLGTASGGPHQAAHEVELMLRQRVDGLLVACSWPAEFLGPHLAAFPVPVVLANTDGPGVGVPQFGTDNREGARLVVEHLVDLGHRRIAYVGGRPSAPFHEIRLAGMRTAIRVAGLDPGALSVLAGDGTSTGGQRAVRELLEVTTGVTAVACYNDVTAIGVLHGLHRAGLKVPRDVSVIGFDDIAEAVWLDPALTTVHQETRTMSRLAADRLVDLMRGGPGELHPQPVRLPMSLRVRESTRPPR